MKKLIILPTILVTLFLSGCVSYNGFEKYQNNPENFQITTADSLYLQRNNIMVHRTVLFFSEYTIIDQERFEAWYTKK